MFILEVLLFQRLSVLSGVVTKILCFKCNVENETSELVYCH